MMIRKMCIDDVPTVLRLGTNISAFEVAEQDIFWSNDQLRDWITADEDVLLVAEDSGAVVGFTLSTFHKPTKKVTWENLYVSPEFRNKGVGRQLIEELMLRFKQKGVQYVCFLVRAENLAEISYFHRQGFKKGYNFIWFGKYI